MADIPDDHALTWRADKAAAARGAIAGVAGQALSRASAVAFVVYAGRLLGADGYSRYAVASTMVVLGSVLGDFGRGAAASRLVAQGELRAERLAGVVVGTAIIVGSAAAFIVALLGFIIYSGVQAIDIAVAAFAVPFLTLGQALLGVCDGLGRLRLRPLATSAQTVAVAASGTLFLLVTGDVRWAVSGIVVGSAVMAVLAWRTTSAALGHMVLIPTLRSSDIGSLVGTALPFGFSAGVTILFQRIDILLLSVLGTTNETAVYEVAVRGIEVPALIAMAVCSSYVFVFHRLAAMGAAEPLREVVTGLVQVLQAVALPVAAIGLAVGDRVIVAVFGAGFNAGAKSAAILALGTVVYFHVIVQGALAQSGTAYSKMLLPSVVALALMVGMDIALIPAYGAVGAAAVTVAAMIVQAVLLHRHLARHTLTIVPLPSPRTAMCASGAGLVALGLRSRPLLAVVIALLVYVVSLFGTMRGRLLKPWSTAVSMSGWHKHG